MFFLSLKLLKKNSHFEKSNQNLDIRGFFKFVWGFLEYNIHFCHIYTVFSMSSRFHYRQFFVNFFIWRQKLLQHVRIKIRCEQISLRY